MESASRQFSGDCPRQTADSKQVVRDNIEGIYEGFNPVLLSFCRKLTPAGMDPENIAAETWLRAFTKIERWEGATPFKAYLFKIAKHLIVAQIRRSQRWSKIHNKLKQDCLGETNAQEGEYELTMQQIMDKIKEPESRDIIHRRFVEKHSYRTIASDMQLPSPDAARKKVKRILANIKPSRQSRGKL